ncbi:MAG TPA: GIY-YIG nuclease family protein [Phycisphaerae bacterium]|nr:GIY-YIG nuclease family protein [Phycisphaerae bacterium]HRR87349.1 GIY-YIG nuclease family protein [Phycisphaerae bacterium]
MGIGYAYILRCNDDRYYYGSTNDLLQRLRCHRCALVKSTRWRLPVRLVWYEQHETLERARQREYSFKNGRTRRKAIEHLIATFPPDKLTPFA